MPRKELLKLVVGLVVLFVWLIPGCGDDEITKPPVPDIDCDSALTIIGAANDSLASQMNVVINQTLDNPDSSFRPRDIDFAGVNSLYEQAVAICPSNLDAQFGAAFTGLLLYLTDSELNDLVDRIKDVVDTMSSAAKMARPLRMLPDIDFGGPLAPDAIPMTAGGFVDALPSLVSLDYAVVSAAAADPQISEIQSNLENRLLPKIISARSRLVNILNSPGYTFTITPEMQGNNGADSVVMDRTDFSVFLAISYAAEAALHVFFARDLDINSYSLSDIESALNTGSTFLGLKAGGVGATHMSDAKTGILLAKDALVNAVNYLLAEIGSTDQTYALIEIPTGGAADLNQFRDSLNYYFTYFNGAKDIDVTINGKDTVLSVDISKFFDAPMDNPKNFIPAYSITITEMDSLFAGFAAMHFNRDKYWDSLQSIYGLTSPNDTPFFDYHLPDQNSAEFYSMLSDRGVWPAYGSRQFVFGWDDLYHWGGSDTTNIWYYESMKMRLYHEYYEDREEYFVEACYQWTANLYTAWSFPDPTFNGLLPAMTSDKLKEMILNDSSSWQKSECDTLDFD